MLLCVHSVLLGLTFGHAGDVAAIENYMCIEDSLFSGAVAPIESGAILDGFDEFGHSVTQVVGLNGDGLSEIAVGVPRDDGN